MSDDVKHDVVSEVVAPSAEEGTQVQEQSQEPQKGSAEYNFREMRRLLQEQQRRIQELETQQYQEEPQEQEEDIRFEKDDIPTWGQLEKVIEKKAEQKARQLLEKQQKDSLEDRVRMKFKDYDDVVSEEFVENVIKTDPILVQTLKSSPDPYMAAYNIIKKSAYYAEKSQPKKKAVDPALIEQNAKKPVSSNSVKNAPSAAIQAAGVWSSFSEDDKKRAYERMMAAASRGI